ncbi:MAG: prepilin-type N-terminal cleavage/methylation domain-containing protein, partial [Myxococcales bacterium]|nr:prepilin-type N-terminal cleavage/methylation domain-containing protein [Myxococcales bacterium]
DPRTRLVGFTLVELMVVLAVMGVLVSAALPSIGEGFADRRVAMVAREVVGLFQRARYMSSAYGRAHQVVYDNDSGTGLTAEPFAFETLRGTAGGCSVSSFENASGITLADLDCDNTNHWRCVDHLYASTYDANPADNDLVRVDGWGDTTFCYEAGSNNQVFIDTTLYTNWDAPRSQAGFGFVVYRDLGGKTTGVGRKVLIPSGTGSPRILR